MSETSIEARSARERWNRRYTERGFVPFPDRPAEWLVENRAVLTGPGGRRALDLACGDGRNALFLAQLGFDVVAVDVSDVAINALRKAAVNRGLAVDARRVDLEDEALPGDRYDVIVQINYLQRDLFGSLARALTSGGILIVETESFQLSDDDMSLIDRHWSDGRSKNSSYNPRTGDLDGVVAAALRFKMVVGFAK